MVAIGCTGVIGSGKSTVSAQLALRGAVLIDADAISRAVTAPGGPALAPIMERFGNDLVDDDGRLDRARLAGIVFQDKDARVDLEAIVLPLVDQEIDVLRGDRDLHEIVVIDLPLLVETNGRERYRLDGVVVVDTPEDMAIERLVRDRGMRADDAQARIAAQATRDERLRAADFVIMNMGTFEELTLMVDRAWEWMVNLQG